MVHMDNEALKQHIEQVLWRCISAVVIYEQDFKTT